MCFRRLVKAEGFGSSGDLGDPGGEFLPGTIDRDLEWSPGGSRVL
jgi:hypothetical protein